MDRQFVMLTLMQYFQPIAKHRFPYTVPTSSITKKALKKSIFNVNSLPLYCLKQFPKVSGKSSEWFLNYAPQCGDGDGRDKVHI